MLTLVLTGTPLRVRRWHERASSGTTLVRTDIFGYDVGTYGLSRSMADPATLNQLARSIRPKNFSGLDRDWPSWKLKLKNCMSVTGNTMNDINGVTEQALAYSRLLSKVPVGRCSGAAAITLRRTESQNGLEAWRQL